MLIAVCVFELLYSIASTVGSTFLASLLFAISHVDFASGAVPLWSYLLTLRIMVATSHHWSCSARSRSPFVS